MTNPTTTTNFKELIHTKMKELLPRVKKDLKETILEETEMTEELATKLTELCFNEDVFKPLFEKFSEEDQAETFAKLFLEFMGQEFLENLPKFTVAMLLKESGRNPEKLKEIIQDFGLDMEVIKIKSKKEDEDDGFTSSDHISGKIQ